MVELKCLPVFVEAHKENFSHRFREPIDIEYIVIHYTGNVNDTAKNNAEYFRDNSVKSSAHYFCWENTIYQSVLAFYPAYAVGLGKRKEPYFRYPTFWKKCTNSNSISVEICGSKRSSEASENTKDTAANLVAYLLEFYNLPLSRLIRHYDVTGKRCPAWAVEDEFKFLNFKLRVSNYLSGGDDNILLNNEENYKVFKEFMRRYMTELADAPTAEWEKAGMTFASDKGLMKDGRSKSFVTRAELATVLMRLNG